MKKNLKFACITFLTFMLSSLIISCNRKEGYGAVLWALPEYGIQDGDIVPVYSKSNIIHKYVIGTPTGEKIEIPLWQITEPSSKSKANKNYKKISEFEHKFASSKTNGLPCRAEPKNLAKQVYRLRKGEVIKLLSLGEGDAVMKGKEELPGEWYKILTKDGTIGWCYSYNLNVYELDENGNQIGGDVVVDLNLGDDIFEQIFDKNWYPEQYKRIIDSEVIDTTIVKVDYGFSIDTEKGKINLVLPENKTIGTKAIKESWNYNGYEKTGRKQYTLTDLPLVVTVSKEDVISVRYTRNSGKPQDFVMVTFEDDLSELIKDEKSRRAELYSKIVSKGPNYVSTSYGNLNFNSSYAFNWTGYNEILNDSIIPKGANTTGTVILKYVVDKKYANQYDGVLTLKFDGASSEEINFLFKLESDGLRLEDAIKASFVDGRISERSMSPLVLYFRVN